MTSRSRAIKLFAVVALAGACDQGKPKQPARPQSEAQPKAQQAQPQAQPAAAATRAPRTLPNGAPACGNVGGKAPIPEECKNLR